MTVGRDPADRVLLLSGSPTAEFNRQADWPRASAAGDPFTCELGSRSDVGAQEWPPGVQTAHPKPLSTRPGQGSCKNKVPLSPGRASCILGPRSHRCAALQISAPRGQLGLMALFQADVSQSACTLLCSL